MQYFNILLSPYCSHMCSTAVYLPAIDKQICTLIFCTFHLKKHFYHMPLFILTQPAVTEFIDMKFTVMQKTVFVFVSDFSLTTANTQ